MQLSKDIEFIVKPLSTCLAVSRKEKLKELVTDGNINKVWIIPGHVFVLSNNGKQLSTFDCKPAHLQQYDDSVFLDFCEIQYDIIDILPSPLHSKTVFIVFGNGVLQIWHYTDKNIWKNILEIQILTGKNGHLISFCAHEEHSAIYWCEQNGDIYNICKMKLPKDKEEFKDKFGVGPIDIILSNIPACNLYHIQDFLFIVTRPISCQVQVCISWRPSSDHITIYIRGMTEKLDGFWTNEEIDFRNLILRCLPLISKANVSEGKSITIQNSFTQEIVILKEDGDSELFQIDQEHIGNISRKEISIPTSLCLQSDQIFMSKRFLTETLNNSIKLYMLENNSYELIQELVIHECSLIHGVIQLLNPVYVCGLLTDKDIFLIQRCYKKERQIAEVSEDLIFQSKALQYSKLHQNQKQDGINLKELSNLKSEWMKEMNEAPKSILTEALSPYIDEFWRLQDLSIKPPPLDESININELKEELHGILSGTINAPLSWQQSQLLILSEKYPEDVLDILLSDLKLTEDDIEDIDMNKWKRILGLDTTDMSKTFLFNHLCRLLYKLRPQFLVKFVKMAQVASERNIGVSAFVRKRHLLQYYLRALECLPNPDVSAQPTEAILATSQLLLACGDKDSTLKTIKFLLKYEQWSEVIEIIKDHKDNPQYSIFLYLFVTSLSKKEKLVEFSQDIKVLIPEWQRCTNIDNIFDEEAEPKSGSMTAIASIQPLLEELFKLDGDC